MKHGTSGNGVGGGERVGGIQPRISTYTPMNPNHDVSDNRDHRTADLMELIAAVARHALDTNPLLSPKQKERLKDIERGRYSDKLLRALVEGMVGAKNPMTLADTMRGAVLRQMATPAPCILDTFLAESRAQAQADVAQVMFLTERIPSRRDQLLDAVSPHIEALIAHKDAALAWNPTGRRYA